MCATLLAGTVNEANSARTRPRRSTGCSEAVVIVGGCDRDGSYNMPYVEAYDAVAHTWTQLAKIPAYTKAEYAVTSFGNSIILSGGKIHSRDVWLYQVCGFYRCCVVSGGGETSQRRTCTNLLDFQIARLELDLELLTFNLCN